MKIIQFDTRNIRTAEEAATVLRVTILNSLNSKLVLLHDFLNDFNKILDSEITNLHPKLKMEIIEKARTIAEEIDELGEKYLKKTDLATDLALIIVLLTATVLTIEVANERLGKFIEEELGKLGGVKGEGYEQR